jgi:hypothetical protein
LMRELATIPGVAGVHIMAPGNEAAIARGSARRAGSSGEIETPRFSSVNRPRLAAIQFPR